MSRPLGSRPALRAVTPQDTTPLTPDEAIDGMHEHWKAARQAYADLLAAIGLAGNLRWLIVGPPGGGMSRGSFVGLGKTARDIATKATVLADHFDRCVDRFDRAKEGPR